jgi:hypothetical protein
MCCGSFVLGNIRPYESIEVYTNSCTNTSKGLLSMYSRREAFDEISEIRVIIANLLIIQGLALRGN